MLDHLAVVHVAGDDAATFLHGQLSCHVMNLVVSSSTYGSYNTPKGRMLATFLLVRSVDGFHMLVDRSVVAGFVKRLQMFIMRSKVRLSDVSAEFAAVGLLGVATDRALAALTITLQPLAHAGTDMGSRGQWTRLDGGRVLGIVARTELERVGKIAPDTWATSADWIRADIHAGIARITAATQDALVPQMANLDLIGGVHFDKGCYPGQEIVARTQHLGRVKRRMIAGHVEAAIAPQAGDPVVGAALGNQASGLIVNVVPDPSGGFDVLAVMQTSTIATNDAHVGAIDGPRIEIRPLPYALPA